MIYLLLAVLLLAAYLFLRHLKGRRTVIFGALTTGFGAVVPLLTEIVGYLQTLDWRSYVLEGPDRGNVKVLVIVGGLGVAMIVLRFLTTGPVGAPE